MYVRLDHMLLIESTYLSKQMMYFGTVQSQYCGVHVTLILMYLTFSEVVVSGEFSASQSTARFT